MKIEINDIPKHKIKWASICIWVDQDTGAILTKHEAATNYIKIKTTKHANIKANYGTITHTIECRRTNQQKLPFN